MLLFSLPLFHSYFSTKRKFNEKKDELRSLITSITRTWRILAIKLTLNIINNENNFKRYHRYFEIKKEWNEILLQIAVKDAF